MELHISIEAQNAFESGLAEILHEVSERLAFVAGEYYGTEFCLVAIIPTCVDDAYWNALGWKERVQVWRKKREADIRLRMDYARFVGESYENKRLMFIQIIVASVQALQERSKGDFKGDLLIRDILKALNVRQTQLDRL